MTPEELIRLFGYPAVPFGGTPEPQPIPQPPAPVPPAPVAAPVNVQTPPAIPAPEMQQPQIQKPFDFKALAAQQALRMLAQPDEQQSPAMPLGMALMAMGQQMQTPRALRGRNDNLQSMANALLAWQIKNQGQQEQSNQRKIAAMSTLEKLYAPTKLGKGEVLLGQDYQPVASNPEQYNLGENQQRMAGNKIIATGPKKEPNMHFGSPVADESGQMYTPMYDPRTGQMTKLPLPGGKMGTPTIFVDPNDPQKREVTYLPQLPSNPNMIPLNEYLQQMKIPQMSPDQVDSFAIAFLDKGKYALPHVGGWMGGILHAKIQGRAMDLAREKGIDLGTILANQGEFEGLGKSLNKIETNYAQAKQSIGKTNYHLQTALDLADKVNNTGVPVFNRWLNAGKRGLTDDPDLAAFDTNVRLAVAEAARATTNVGVVSDTARTEIDKILNTQQAPNAFKASAGTLKDMMHAVDRSYQDEIGRIKGGMKSMPSTYGQQIQLTGQPQPSGRPNYQPKPGETIAPDKNGKWWITRGGQVIGPVP